MNFDDLQQQWKDEPSDNVQIPTDIDVLRKAQTPIDEVRKKMKKDFKSQVFGLAIYGVYPLIFGFSHTVSFFYYVIYILAALFSGYFYYLFWGFYKQSYDLTFESKKNLTWFYYELRLNIVLYKSLSYIGFVMLLAFLIVVLSLGKFSPQFSNFMNSINDFNKQLTVIALLVFVIPFSITITELMTKKFYGIHLEKIKKVLDELDEL